MEFKPEVLDLESRQLMAITLNKPLSSLIFNMYSYANAKQTGNATCSLDTVVGAGYNLGVNQNQYAQIASVTYAMPHSLDGDGVTGYKIDKGYYGYRTSVTVVCPAISGPHATPGIHQYLDATTGTVNLDIDVKYVVPSIPDDKYQITLNVYAPSGSLVANFPPAVVSSPTAYWIGPRNASNDPVPWVYNTSNSFGVGGYGQYPFEFGGIGSNANNPVTGDFFLSQVATVTSVGSKGALFYGPLGGNYTPWSDVGGRSDLALDEWPNQSGIPLATYGQSVRAVGNWSLPVIIKSVTDNPGSVDRMSSYQVPYRLYYHGSFRTMLCFQGWGDSIPIVLSYVDWKVDYDFYNKAAQNSATAANAFTDPKLWAGSATVTPGVPVNNSLSVFPRYNYNLPAYLGTIQDRYLAQGASHGQGHVRRHSVSGHSPVRLERVDYSGNLNVSRRDGTSVSSKLSRNARHVLFHSDFV